MMTIVALLFNSLWESLIVLLVAALVLRIARNSNATTRYAVWTAALVCSIALPILTTVTMAPRNASVSAPTWPTLSAARTTRVVQMPHAAVQAVVAKAAAGSTPAIRRPQFTISSWFVLSVAAIWGLVSLFNGIRFAISFAVLEGLKKNATPLPIEYRNRLSHWQARVSGSHRVRLCVSDEISVPVAVGIFDAMILLPLSLVDELEADDIDRIVLHEYAHLSRGDDWINAFERIALAVFFFNPAIRFIARQMDIEREVSCDDSVVQTSGEALPLATCLVKMVEKVSWPYEPLAAPGVFDTRRNLSLRVERLLMFARDRRTSISAVPTLGAVVAMFALVLIGALVSPKFVAALPEPKPLHVAQAPQRAAKVPEAAKIVSHAKTARPVHDKFALQTTPKTLATNALLPPTHPARSVLPQPLKHPAVTLPRKHIAQGSRLPVQPRNFDQAKIPAPVSIAANAQGGDYISDLASAGYKNLSVDEITQLKYVGVTAGYIRSLQSAGFHNLSTRDLIEARATNLNADYARAIHARLGDLSLRQTIELGAVGVTIAYIDQLAAAGYRGLSVRDLEEVRALGIDQAFINNANAHGFRNLTIDQLIRLKTSGVL